MRQYDVAFILVNATFCRRNDYRMKNDTNRKCRVLTQTEIQAIQRAMCEHPAFERSLDFVISAKTPPQQIESVTEIADELDSEQSG